MAIRCSCSDHRHFRAASTQRSKGKSRQAEQQIDFDSFRFHFYITSGIFICCLFASIECLGEEIFIVKLGDMIMFENCVCEMSQKSLLVFVSVTEMNFLGKFFEIFSFGFRKAFHCFRIAFQKL